MVDTAADSVNLANLEKRLQQQTNTLAEETSHCQVDCQFREETLIVLVHTAVLPRMGPESIFSCLKQTLEREFYQLNCPVLIYLMVASQEPPDIFEYELPQLQPLSLMQRSRYWLSDRLGWPSREMRPLSRPIKFGLLAIGLSVGVLGIYGLTRPCTFGNCPPLHQAQALAQVSKQDLARVTSLSDLVTIQGQLQEALQLLKTIPFWSQQRKQADRLSQQYQEQLQPIEPLIETLQLGQEISALSDPAPLSPEQWQQVITQWQEAIARLRQGLLPPQTSTSPTLPPALTPFSQRTMRRYQNNLFDAQQQLAQEQQAATDLNEAKAAAQLAQQRQAQARSLEDWQRVRTTWETALSRLDAIPETTTVYALAQQERTIYRGKTKAAQEQENNEQLALQRYQQAQQQAQLARNAAENHNWSAALTHWQQGLTYLQQIPLPSALSGQVTPAIAVYNNGMTHAQTQLQHLKQWQQVQTTLENTCGGRDNICSYSIRDEGILIQLRPAYLRQVQQTAQDMEASDNDPTKMELLAHLTSLEKRLQDISQSTKLSVQVYHPDGTLIVTYEPS